MHCATGTMCCRVDRERFKLRLVHGRDLWPRSKCRRLAVRTGHRQLAVNARVASPTAAADGETAQDVHDGGRNAASYKGIEADLAASRCRLRTGIPAEASSKDFESVLLDQGGRQWERVPLPSESMAMSSRPAVLFTSTPNRARWTSFRIFCPHRGADDGPRAETISRRQLRGARKHDRAAETKAPIGRAGHPPVGEDEEASRAQRARLRSEL